MADVSGTPPWSRSRRADDGPLIRRAWGVDAILASLALITAAWVGTTYVRIPEVASSASYYQEEMGPSVLLACDRSFADPRLLQEQPGPAGAALRAFLARETDSFDCGLLPAQLPEARLSPMQAASRYTLLAVAAIWRGTGVSWSALAPWFGLLYGASGALAFLAARSVLSRPWAVVIAALMISSPVQLGQLPHLRDYAKAPFFLATLWILLTLVRQPVPPRTLVLRSAIVGAILGVAFGVRFDMTVFLAFYVASVVLFLPGSWREHVRPRVAAAAAAVATFVVTALPVFMAFELGHNSWHVVLLGLSSPYDPLLGVRPSVYDVLPFYNDSYVTAAVNAFAVRTGRASELLFLSTAEYGRAGAAYYMALAQTFPADVALRACAAIIRVLDAPFALAAPAPGVPGMTLDGFDAQVYSVRGILAALSGAAPWLSMGAVAVVASVNVRLALFIAAGLCFFGAITSMQFHTRHTFHLEILPLLLFGVVFAGIWERLVRTRRGAAPVVGRPPLANRLTTAVLVAIAAPATGLIAIVLSRSVQAATAAPVLRAYADAPVANVPLTWLATGDGYSRIELGLPVTEPQRLVRSALLVIEVGGLACDETVVPVRVSYEPVATTDNLSRTVTIRVPDAAAAITRTHMPVFQPTAPDPVSVPYRFIGLDVPSGFESCVTRIGRIEGAEKYPLLLDASLPPEWADLPLHQTLVGWEESPFDRDVTIAVFPAGHHVSRADWTKAVQPLGDGVEYTSRAARVMPAGEVAIASRRVRPNEYLVAWRPDQREREDLLIVQGELRSGSIVVGLQRDGQWVAQVPVNTTGAFRVAIRVPETGPYAAILANHVTSRWSLIDAQIDRAGWIRPLAAASAR